MRLKTVWCSRAVKFNTGDYENFTVTWGEEHELEPDDDEQACRKEVQARVNRGFLAQLRRDFRELNLRRTEERDAETKVRMAEIGGYISRFEKAEKRK